MSKVWGATIGAGIQWLGQLGLSQMQVLVGTLESLKKCVLQFNKLSYLCCYCSKYVYFLEIYFLSGRCSAISQ